MIGQRWFYCGVAMVLAMACCSCSAGREPAPELLNGRILVGPNLNPNDAGRPSPVFLRIYQLKSTDVFLSASFNDLVSGDSQVLADALLSKQVLDLCPAETPVAPAGSSGRKCQGKRKKIVLELLPAAKYVAVLAEFYDLRDPVGAWRAVAGIPKDGWFSGRGELSISVNRAAVSIGFE